MFFDIVRSDRPAFILSDGTAINYASLSDDIEAFLPRLDHGPGLIGIQCDGDYRQYVAYLAALRSKSPVLLLGPDQSAEQTGLSLSYLYTPVADTLAHLPDGAKTWHPDLAVLLSTSGTTGEAKWVKLSFRNVQSNAASIAEYLTLSSEDRAPMALPFQYSYGMSVVNSHLAVGAALVLCEGSVVDAAFWETFERTGCTSLAGVPHSFELMEQAKIRTDSLGSLRYMTQAGGRLDPDRVLAWTARGKAEGWDFFVMYGQTEAAPRISYLPPSLVEETPDAIGVPVPGGHMWVATEAGDPVEDGADGELMYQGPNTMMGYATSDANLIHPQGTDILKTGDIARRLPNGTFKIVGRIKRFVKLYGLRVSLDEVEKHLRGTGYDAVCSARGDSLYVLLVGATDSAARSVEQDLVSWLKLPPGSFHVHAVDAVPRQASGKVDYRAIDALVEGMAAQMEAETSSGATGRRGLIGRLLPSSKASVAEVFQSHFPTKEVTSETSFTTLGGDSLSYVAISLDLETVLGHLPQDWAEMSVSDLQARARGRSWFTHIDMPTLVRALAIILIVGGHFGAYQYGGSGAQALFFVAGISLAQFTLPQILRTGSVASIVILMARLAMLTFAYNLLNLAVTGYGEWPAFVFVSNWISPDVAGGAWFIEVYLQLLLAIALLFSFSAVRNVFAWRSFPTAAVGAALFVIIGAVADAMVDTDHLYRRLPHLYAWFLLTGLAVGLTRTTLDKIIVTAIFFLGYWQFVHFAALPVKFLPFAAVALIWISSVPLPRVPAVGIRRIAGASLFIYLSHFQFREVSHVLFGPSSFAAWATAILGGVIVWRLYEPVDRWITNRIWRFLGRSERTE